MLSKKTPLVGVSIHDAVACLTLSRPHKRNALSLQVVSELREAFESLPDTVRAVVLDGQGEHFCAGLDLSELAETSPAEGLMHSRIWYEAFERIQFGQRPVVCVMHGAVIGGGLELASVAHVRVAEQSAYFGLPEGQRGIFLGGGGSVRVSKLIGASRVGEMMLTGRVYTAEEGLQVGLTHYVVGAGEGRRKGMELAQRIASNAPLSNFAIMHALPLIAEQTMAHGLMTEGLMATVTQSDGEAKARMRAFLEKRVGKVVPTSGATQEAK
ncbi:crotonase/enoyl-CoA hydratase family protein [Paucibacter sp. PLA-PC-4]|uniref:crotonase/enoyl-CoA hydratase family protein n=1 Tax=Paucibacter sp. PLA-PC-4 TaxID=2993655 RepID=UPI0022491153|nr:crotonase/enoyl-CoA hydratase family protein [Paucibacter sp. PLA-PC-4]MCX2863348.1 crotonase/enoyl-CoA hydratase family protein [Paucibacter sp. PLA-PC-4]